MSTGNLPESRQAEVSLAMIVRNGGQLLNSLLSAAKPYVREIVIGDTGSTDDSLAVAHCHGARVLSLTWQEDFAVARNAVLPHCRSRWILVMDHDENLAPSDWQNLGNVVTELDQRGHQRAGRILTRNYLTERHGKRGWTEVPSPDLHALPGGPPAPGFVASQKVRLFPNHPEIRFTGRLHETVEASLANRAMAAVELDFPVHHFGLLREDTAKAERYLNLARRKAVDEPHKARTWSELADCAIACGQHAEALSAIDRALILDPADPALRLTAGWLLFETGQLEPADLQLAAAGASGSIDDATLAEVCHLRAQIAMQTGRAPAAAPLLAVALRLAPGNGHYVNTLGAWQLQMGRGLSAQQTLDRASRLIPTNPGPQVNLAVLYQTTGNLDLARQCLDKALQLDPAHLAARRMQSELEQAGLPSTNQERPGP